jgi:hypothetical protein
MPMSERKKNLPPSHAGSLASSSRRDVLFALASAWSSTGRPPALGRSAANASIGTDGQTSREDTTIQDCRWFVSRRLTRLDPVILTLESPHERCRT